MSEYYCPLCKQEVSRSLYEKITGVWQEKEKRLASLKQKEKQLLQREKKQKEAFDKEKKKIVAREQKKQKKELKAKEKSFKELISKEQTKIKEQKKTLEKSFQKKLGTEVNKVLKQEKKHQKEMEKKLKKDLKEKFDSKAKQFINKEKEKIKKSKTALEKRTKVQKNRFDRLNKQFVSLQDKSRKSLERSDKKIKLLEEQIKKNQTPQMLGLLEESIFLDKLKQSFPKDKFTHPGKKGDIVHYVREKGKDVGIIVYELKKVSNFNKKHITQAYEAKQKRNADYGMLVTNAKRSKKDFGFSVSKGILIIHPAGALVLINMLRDHMVKISTLKLSSEKRKKTINAVLQYIQSPQFRNGIEGVIEDTKDLYCNLTKEVKDHVKGWEVRLKKYRNIYANAYDIESKAVKLLVEKKGSEALKKEEIEPISLPSKIV